jgi:N-acetylglucosaminyldiphosphoundecaprenol N-acetyl-beta-D-mannosaminyltransferase
MKYDILGIKIDRVNIKNISRKITDIFNQKDKKKNIIFYVNAHSMNVAFKRPSFKLTLNQANMIYCGGLGPVMAARLLNSIKLIKTTTPDFIHKVFRYMEKHNKSVFFLGSKDEILDEMILKISKEFPNLDIKGSYNGYFSNVENAELIKKLNRLKPDLLLVGMGSPKQEEWIISNYKHINAKVFWSVGAIFEVLSGKYKRLPKIFNDYGFEWIFRLIQEPRRLWKRYLIGNANFLILLIFKIVRKKIY